MKKGEKNDFFSKNSRKNAKMGQKIFKIENFSKVVHFHPKRREIKFSREKKIVVGVDRTLDLRL